jgi:sec-independent protein translocase protein TatB
MVSPPPIELATLGWEDSLILMVLALVVFGPRRLPLIGRQIGKLMYEFRKASNDFKFQMEEELRAAEEADRRKKEEAERERLAALAAQSQASVSAPPQSVEAEADIGAVEAPTASGDLEAHPPESSVSASGTEPTIHPPRTGEQVSTSPRPDYFFEPSGDSRTESPAAVELNPEADAEANAASMEAQAAARGESEMPAETDTQPGKPVVSDSPTASKEPVSQHG